MDSIALSPSFFTLSASFCAFERASSIVDLEDVFASSCACEIKSDAFFLESAIFFSADLFASSNCFSACAAASETLFLTSRIPKKDHLWPNETSGVYDYNAMISWDITSQYCLLVL